MSSEEKKRSDMINKFYTKTRIDLISRSRTTDDIRGEIEDMEDEDNFEACAGMKKALDEYLLKLTKK